MGDYQRIEEVLRHYGLSARALALALNLKSPQVFYDIKAGKCGISKELATKIQEHFLNISAAWLLTGDGNMLRGEGSMLNAAGKNAPTDDSTKPFALVPLINIDSVGGVHSNNTISASEQYTINKIPFTDAREGDVAILQSGNSMSPTIPPGSVLLIREVVDWREYLDSGVYVIWLKDDRRITKEIRRYAPDPQNYVLCVSYNPDVADEPLPRSLIRGVWKVIKYIADFGW